jgi:hypothetical protein
MQTPTSSVYLACAVAAVPRLDELRLVDLVEGADQAVDPVAGIAVDPVDTPFAEAFENEFRDVLGHGHSLSVADGLRTTDRGYPR